VLIRDIKAAVNYLEDRSAALRDCRLVC